jgi:hypothetical protein
VLERSLPTDHNPPTCARSRASSGCAPVCELRRPWRVSSGRRPWQATRLPRRLRCSRLPRLHDRPDRRAPAVLAGELGPPSLLGTRLLRPRPARSGRRDGFSAPVSRARTTAPAGESKPLPHPLHCSALARALPAHLSLCLSLSELSLGARAPALLAGGVREPSWRTRARRGALWRPPSSPLEPARRQLLTGCRGTKLRGGAMGRPRQRRWCLRKNCRS